MFYHAGSSRPRRLSSLPVPLGVRRGAVVFECGSAVRRAGRHRAYITVNGERVAESEVMKVGQFPGKINKKMKIKFDLCVSGLLAPRVHHRPFPPPPPLL